MTDELMDFLAFVAKCQQLEYGFKPADRKEWLIKVNDTINSTLLTLDMRYQTYAEGSWSQAVYKAFTSDTIQNCDCDDCGKWKMRAYQMVSEVEYAISCLIHKQTQEKENN